MNKDEIVGTLVRYAVMAEKKDNSLLCEAYVTLAMLVASGEVPAGFEPGKGIWVEENGPRTFVGPLTSGGLC